MYNFRDNDVVSDIHPVKLFVNTSFFFIPVSRRFCFVVRLGFQNEFGEKYSVYDETQQLSASSAFFLSSRRKTKEMSQLSPYEIMRTGISFSEPTIRCLNPALYHFRSPTTHTTVMLSS